MSKIKCLVVDDEELARVLLETYINKLDFLELIACVEDPIEAMQLFKTTKIDLLFLDIQMPNLKGTDFAKMITTQTQIIFTTAYSEYALEGYDLNVLDYLLKPITFERFLIAIDKVKSKSAKEDTLTIKSGYDLYKLKYDAILFIESDSEYVNFYTEDKKIMSHQSLKKLAEILPSHMFMRVHRSYIINKSKVSALKGRDLIIGDKEIPVSAQYFEAVKTNLF